MTVKLDRLAHDRRVESGKLSFKLKSKMMVARSNVRGGMKGLAKKTHKKARKDKIMSAI